MGYFKIRWHNDGKIIKNCFQGIPKMSLKPAPRGPKRVIPIDLSRFWALGGPRDLPKTSPGGPKRPPCRPNMSVRRPQDGPRSSETSPKRPQNAPQEAPRRPKRSQDVPYIRRQDVPKTPQDGPRWPRVATKMSQYLPKSAQTRQDASKMFPRGPETAQVRSNRIKY